MRIYIDVTNYTHGETKAGIPRVLYGIIKSISSSTYHDSISLLTFIGEQYYVISNPLNSNTIKERFNPTSKDIFLGLDLRTEIYKSEGYLKSLFDSGMKLYFVVYDTIPLDRWDCFQEQAAIDFKKWFIAISTFATGLICISKSVRIDTIKWLERLSVPHNNTIELSYYYNGHDFFNASFTDNLIGGKEYKNKYKNNFILVSTLEPRKGHTFILSVFDRLWTLGFDAQLTFIGKKGWMVDNFCKQITKHKEFGKRFFWVTDCDDNQLQDYYMNSSAILSPSDAEGYGLPLIEASALGLPVICSDIEVYREIVTSNVKFIKSGCKESWVLAIKNQTNDNHRLTKIEKSHTNSWQDATNSLIEILVNKSEDIIHWSQHLQI